MKFCSMLVDRRPRLPIVLIVMVFNAPAWRTVEAAALDGADTGWEAGNTVEMPRLKVTLSKPVLVARSKGYLWFPTVVRLSNGELAAMMSDYADEQFSGLANWKHPDTLTASTATGTIKASAWARRCWLQSSLRRCASACPSCSPK